MRSGYSLRNWCVWKHLKSHEVTGWLRNVSEVPWRRNWPELHRNMPAVTSGDWIRPLKTSQLKQWIRNTVWGTEQELCVCKRLDPKPPPQHPSSLWNELIVQTNYVAVGLIVLLTVSQALTRRTHQYNSLEFAPSSFFLPSSTVSMKGWWFTGCSTSPTVFTVFCKGIRNEGFCSSDGMYKRQNRATDLDEYQ